MNKTGIEWCDMTFNPITGCYHNCEYCYAMKQSQRFRGHFHEKDGKTFPCHTYSKYSIHKKTGYCIIAEADIQHLHGERELRPASKDPDNKDVVQYFPIFQLDAPLEYLRKDDTIQDASYPFGFLPTFHRYRLDEPQKVKKPQNVFVGSMADVFGEWVSDKWIEEVFKACEAAPQHRYLFLTKNPKRYEKIYRDMPKNFWYGHTATCQKEMMSNQETRHNAFCIFNAYLSLEPLRESIKFDGFVMPDWVIVGAETGNRKGKTIPKREWIENIVNVCRAANVPVFLKNNLKDVWESCEGCEQNTNGCYGECRTLIQEFPWEVPS